MEKKKFEVKVYSYPKTFRIEADTKAEALDRVAEEIWSDNNIEEITAEEILKDVDSCEKHFEFNGECQDCNRILKKRVENFSAETPIEE